jgi:D-alanyl-lipoteichoic acid acyltransferase DltB (MBOAT superfamily)
MNFNSLYFPILLLLAILSRIFLAKKYKSLYIYFVTILSLIFYAWHIPYYVLILLFSTVVDYHIGRALYTTKNPLRKKALLAASVITNLGVLAFFKYSFLFYTLVGATPVLRYVLDLLYLIPGFSLHFLQTIVLPIGISFYTFQSMSYSIDIYRDKLQPHQSFSDFLFFVSFFPQLVAGPIVRAKDFLYQIRRTRRFHLPVVFEGSYLIIRGFFLKVVIADNIGPIVDRYWEAASQPDASRLLAISVTILFSGQIFSDFAGYSSIARGIAYLLGFRLPINFNAPYIAATFSEFWRRWHISLSQWLRDYLYLSLGGNRKGRRRTYVNLLLVMLLGGLWHGAGINFVVWGGLHGVGLAIERFLGLTDRNRRLSPVVRFAWFAVVQTVVLLCWVFFREGDHGSALSIIFNMVSGSPAVPPGEIIYGLLLLLPIAAIHLRVLVVEKLISIGMTSPGPCERSFWAGVMLFALLTMYGETVAEFIYFQF